MVDPAFGGSSCPYATGLHPCYYKGCDLCDQVAQVDHFCSLCKQKILLSAMATNSTILDTFLKTYCIEHYVLENAVLVVDSSKKATPLGKHNKVNIVVTSLEKQGAWLLQSWENWVFEKTHLQGLSKTCITQVSNSKSILQKLSNLSKYGWRQVVDKGCMQRTP